MNYAIVNPETGIVENIIVCDSDEVAAEFGALPSYDGCAIGERYDPPPVYTEIEQAQQDITDLQLSDLEQGQAMTDLDLRVTELEEQNNA